jgi:hypothetical protein
MPFQRGTDYIAVVPNGAPETDPLREGLKWAACVVSGEKPEQAYCRGVDASLGDEEGGYYSSPSFLVVWGESDKLMADRLANRPRRCIVYVGDKDPGRSCSKLLKLYASEPERTVCVLVNTPNPLRIECLEDGTVNCEELVGEYWVENSDHKPKRKRAKKAEEAAASE